MSSNPIPLAFGNYYHIYNRGNNSENVFVQERNYGYFMDLWWKHTYPIAETYAYCLLKNHFHAVMHVRDADSLASGVDGRDPKKPSQYLSNFFIAYTRGVNLATQRTGALFERPFERIRVTDEPYLMRLILYIHKNAQKHGFVGDFRDWNFSSYHALVGNAPTRLCRERVMSLFGGRENFIKLHMQEDLSGRMGTGKLRKPA